MSIAQWIAKAQKAHRKAVEELYCDVCTIYEQQSVRDPETKKTVRKEVPVLENQPCKISFETITTTSESNGAAEQAISVKLFISPDITVKPGSKVVVTHLGEDTAYSNSGVAGKFPTHQEIKLALFERWA